MTPCERQPRPTSCSWASILVEPVRRRSSFSCCLGLASASSSWGEAGISARQHPQVAPPLHPPPNLGHADLRARELRVEDVSREGQRGHQAGGRAPARDGEWWGDGVDAMSARSNHTPIPIPPSRRRQNSPDQGRDDAVRIELLMSSQLVRERLEAAGTQAGFAWGSSL